MRLSRDPAAIGPAELRPIASVKVSGEVEGMDKAAYEEFLKTLD